MASATTQELELRLAEVEHQLAHLEALERGAGHQAPEGVRAERARRRSALLGERSALLAQLGGPPAPTGGRPSSWPGLWEPLPLYPEPPPPQAAPTEGGAPPAPAPSTEPAPEPGPAGAGPSPAPPSFTEPAELRRQLLTSVAELYPWGRGPGNVDAATVLRSALRRGGNDPAVVRVVCAAGEDFLSVTWLDKVLEPGVARPKRPEEAPPRGAAPAPSLPEAETPDAEGLTVLQRLALEASVLALAAGDRPHNLADLARHLASRGHLVTVSALEASLAPFSEAGGARSPLLWLRRQDGEVHLQLTELGKEVLLPDASGRRLQPGLPLLLLEGHRGPPAAPPHHLGELVVAALQVLRGSPVAPPLTPDLTEGGTLLEGDLRLLEDLGHAELVSLADLRAVQPGGGFAVTLEVRPLLHPMPAAELDARFSAAIASGALDPCAWRLDAGGALTIEVGHVAFLSRLVRWLRAQGLAERRERLGYQVREAGAVTPAGRRDLLRHFVRLELVREAHRESRARAAALERLEVARALVIGAFLHPVVDALIVEADTPAEARWALRHLHAAALWERAPFSRLAGEAGRLEALRASLEAAEPELAQALREGLSQAQAEAIHGARRLGARRQELLGELRRSRAAVAALDAQDTLQVRVEAIARRLEGLASRHADARRTRVVTEAQALPGPMRTPAVTSGP